MRIILNNISYKPDASTVTYKRSANDPVPTCKLSLKDTNSSILVKEMQEVLILDDKLIPNPTANLLVNPDLNPYTDFWTIPSYAGVTLVQQNRTIGALTVFLTSAASAVLPGASGNQLYFNGGSPATTQAFSTIGNNITGWGEMTSQGGGSWLAGASIFAPTGKGFVLDPTFLQGETMQAGNWTPTFRLNAGQTAGVVAGTLGGDLYCRAWKWNSATNTYTLITTSTLLNQTITGVATFAFPIGFGSIMAFGPSDYLYIDLPFNCKINANGVSTQGIRINNLSTDTVGKTGDPLAQIVTPGPIVPAALAITTNNAAVGTDPILENFTVQNQIVPGQNYMLSGYYQWTGPDPNVHGFLQINWFDAAQNVLGQAFYFGPTPGSTSLVRYQVQSVAPPGAVFMKAWFGVQVLNATNTSTVFLSNVQFEAMWFSDISYPTPFCGPDQPNCVQLLNTLGWIRQYRKFAGYVNHGIAGNYIGNSRTWQLDAVGYSWLKGLVFTATRFVNTLDSTILNSLSNSYFSALFNTGSGIEPGITLSNLQPNWDDLRTINNGLAAQSGFFWTDDYYWNTLYQPPGFTTMGISLIADGSSQPDEVTTFPAYNFSQEFDFTQPGCAVLVIGGSPANTALTTALTAGNNYTSLSVNALTQTLPNGLVCSLGGQQGITLSADAAVGATTLNIFSFHALNNYAIGATVTPSPLTALVIDPVATSHYTNALYGSGQPGQIFMRKVNDSTLQSMPDCVNRGIAEVLQYNQARYTYHLMTNVELIPGQGIAVTSDTEGLNQTTLLIQQVSATWIGGSDLFGQDTWEYQADLGATYRSATNILSHIFRATTKNSSAPPVTQTALVVIERIGVQDGPPSFYDLLVFATNPFAYFPLKETAGTIAYDVTGNGGNGTITGGITLGVPGLIPNDPNTAMLLDGSTGDIQTAVTITSWASAQFSISAWFTLNTQTFGTCSLVADSQSNIDNKGFQLLLKANGAGVEFDLGGIGGLSVPSATLTTGKRYRLCGTYDGATMSVYLNGVLVASQAASGALVAPVHTAAIGFNPASSGGFAPVTVGKVAFNAIALSAVQEVALYNAGVKGR